MVQTWLSRWTENRWFGIGFLVSTGLALLCFGIVGIGRDGGLFQTGSDIRFIYVAGQTWLHGLNAYDPEIASRISGNFGIAVERYDFAYPPQIAPFSLFLALFPLIIARWVMLVLNLGAIALLCRLCTHWVANPETAPLKLQTPGYRWTIPALVVGNPFTLHIVWMGQTTLIALAAVMGAWYCMRRDRLWMAGIFIAIATIKPQLSILIVLWFILERRWRILGIAAIAGLIFCLVPMVISGPIEVWGEWFGGIANYKSQPYNSLGFRHMFGIQNVLAIIGLPAPNLLPLAMGLTVALWWYRHKFIIDDLFGVLLGLALLFGFAHDYDLVALIPLLPLFWLHLQDRIKDQWIAIALMLSLFFPQRFLRPIEIDLLLQFRVFIVLILVIWLVQLSLYKSSFLKSKIRNQSASNL
jgi:hypothetical protein